MTPDELQQFAFMKSKFQEMIGKYDFLDAEIKKFHSEITDVQSRMQILLVAQTKEFNESFKKIIDYQAARKSQQEERDRVSKSDYAIVAETQKKCIQDIAEANNRVSNVNGEINLCKAALQKNDQTAQFSQFRKDLHDLGVDLEKKFQALDSRILDNVSITCIANKRVETLNGLLLDLEQNQKNLGTSLSTLNSSVKKSEQDIEALFVKSHNVDSKIAQQINDIPKPLIPSLEDIKKQLQLQFDPVQLDAKNANLRSANNEYKVTVLEKKIEQLSLLLAQKAQG